MSTITLGKRVIIVNKMLSAARRAKSRNGLSVDAKTGFYRLTAEERIAWLGVVDWHLAELAKGAPAK